jgi:hypothetical protein
MPRELPANDGTLPAPDAVKSLDTTLGWRPVSTRAAALVAVHDGSKPGVYVAARSAGMSGGSAIASANALRLAPSTLCRSSMATTTRWPCARSLARMSDHRNASAAA